MKYKNLTVIGTSHIARQSLQEVRQAFEDRPEIVALELDPKRLHAVVSGEQRRPGIGNIAKIGLKGYLFTLIGSFVQRKLGKVVGVSPGSELKEAFLLARQSNARVALIDQDIELTMRNFSKALGWREKLRFLADMLRGLLFPKSEMRRWELDFDLRKVPEKRVVRKMLGRVKERYPGIYKALIEDRNNVMAKNLAAIMRQSPDKKVLAIVGAGHEEEIIALLKKEAA